MALTWKNGKVVEVHMPTISDEDMIKFLEWDGHKVMQKRVEEMRKKGLFPEPIPLEEYGIERLLNELNNDK
jgi:hypothetical protein